MFEKGFRVGFLGVLVRINIGKCSGGDGFY